ncbi:hypothetical protein ACFL2V_18660 [Pseudomonadota bacterium]
MSIYRIHPDRFNFQLITISSGEILGKLGEEYPFHIDPTPKSYAAVWNPLVVEYYDSSENKTPAQIPDITIDSGRLYLSEEAYEGLADILSPFGEFLPILVLQKNAYVFNPLKIAEDIGGVNTKLSFKNDWGDLESLAFHDDKVKEFVVFRSEFDGYMGLFCQEAFKLKIEALGLQGIIFSKDLGNIFPSDPSADKPTAH